MDQQRNLHREYEHRELQWFGSAGIGGSSVTTFNNLTIANAGSGVSLGQNANLNAVLTMTNDLTTGANILTMPNTGTSAGAADVVGNVKRTGFVGGGPALSFGNPFNSIGFIAQGTYRQIFSSTSPNLLRWFSRRRSAANLYDYSDRRRRFLSDVAPALSGFGIERQR